MWDKLEQYIQQNITMNDTLDLSDDCIIFNKIYPKATHVINLLCLVTKQYIYRYQCKKRMPSSRYIIKEFEFLQTIELYYGKNVKRVSHHYKKCTPLTGLNVVNEMLHSAGDTDEYVLDYINSMVM